MKEVWFDTRDGALIIGAEALEASIEQSGIGDIRPLGEVLADNTFPYRAGDFERPRIRDRDREDLLAIGHFIISLISSEDDVPPVLTEAHLQRAYILGLGPERRAYANSPRSPFETITEFQRELGARVTAYNNQYADWSITDFTTYADQLMKELKRLPGERDYSRAAMQGKGPSVDTIKQRGGGLQGINDRLGYPNTRTWDDDDFIDWGMRVLQANPDLDFSSYVSEALSPQRLGPSVRTVIRRFGKWEKFKEKVYREHQASMETRQEKLDYYKDLCRSGALPSEYETLDDDELLRLAGRYVLTGSLLERTDPTIVRDISNAPAFITTLRKMRPGLTAGVIEATAVTLDVYDDIWPSSSSKRTLQISAKEIEAIRKKHSAQNRLATKNKPDDTNQ